MYLVLTLMVMVLVTRIYRRQRYKHYEVRVHDVSKGHRWVMVSMFSKPTYCSISGSNIIHGSQCDSCSICVDDHNMKLANRNIPCKRLSTKGKYTIHHWVHGNLPLCSTCYVCGEICGIQPQLCDFICRWCQRCVHNGCFQVKDNECDFGPYKSVIVPPNCVRLKWVGFKGRRHLIVDSVKCPNIENWSPIIVIANRKSGNNDGESILQAFRSYLNPAQVIDICDIPPESGLEWCHLLPNVDIRVLVCGGDGTIGWVLNAIERLKLDPRPQVCILPLGTGNDLSQVLGWGETFSGEVEVSEILDKINRARVVELDRWNLEINHHSHFRLPYPKKVSIWNNYFSIGVDALVTLNFHRKREWWPGLLSNRIINKVCYFMYGTKDILERECKDLQKKLKVELDGREVILPELEGLVVLNISSWGGGCHAWEIKGDNESQEEYQPARYNDQLLEVFGLHSSFHVAQLQVGMTTPIRIGQARHIKILLHTTAPMQVDGEPWEQHPAEIQVTHRSKATMLSLC